MTEAEQEVLDFIDGLQQGVSLTVLIKSLPNHSVDDIKAATRKLHENILINRLSVMGDNGRFYYVFYSLYIRTVTVHRDPIERHETPAPTPAPTPELVRLAAPPPLPLVIPTILSPDQAVEVLERGGWKAEPEMVERRRPMTAMEVIDRWGLGYRLSRVIEIIGGSRKRKLTRDDAAMVSKLVREHVEKERL